MLYKKKKSSIEKFNLLERKAKKLETELAYAISDAILPLKEQLDLINVEIEQLNQEKTKGCMMRSKMNWLEYGEKSSAYFFSLEQRNYNRKCINKL